MCVCVCVVYDTGRGLGARRPRSVLSVRTCVVARSPGGGPQELLRTPTEVARKRSQAPTEVLKAPTAIVKAPTGQLGITNQHCCSFVRTRMRHVPRWHSNTWQRFGRVKGSTSARTHTLESAVEWMRARMSCVNALKLSALLHTCTQQPMRNVTLTLLCLPSQAPRLAPRCCKTDSQRSEKSLQPKGRETAARTFRSILGERVLPRETNHVTSSEIVVAVAKR